MAAAPKLVALPVGVRLAERVVTLRLAVASFSATTKPQEAAGNINLRWQGRLDHSLMKGSWIFWNPPSWIHDMDIHIFIVDVVDGKIYLKIMMMTKKWSFLIGRIMTFCTYMHLWWWSLRVAKAMFAFHDFHLLLFTAGPLSAILHDPFTGKQLVILDPADTCLTARKPRWSTWSTWPVPVSFGVEIDVMRFVKMK